jgi:hypothetical protein
MNSLQTPVLMLVFNRPDTTQAVFNVIREVKPTKLYIASDGPRNQEDQYKIKQVRGVLSQVDWDCEVYTLFRETNLGCGPAVSQAITWFFEHEEMGIILEDDCLPDSSFFPFCERMLNFYKDDTKVWHIAGSNFISKKLNSDPDKWQVNSYYFSMFNNIWGWAGWRNRWNKYRFNIESYNLHQSLQYYTLDKRVETYFTKRQKQVLNKRINTWDYQYTFSMWENKGCAIIPTVNLISNIGFDVNATNTNIKSDVSEMELGTLNSINFLKKIELKKEIDSIIFEKLFWKPNSLLFKIKNKFFK